jgi:hypothetical protein
VTAKWHAELSYVILQWIVKMALFPPLALTAAAAYAQPARETVEVRRLFFVLF